MYHKTEMRTSSSAITLLSQQLQSHMLKCRIRQVHVVVGNTTIEIFYAVWSKKTEPLLHEQ